MELGLVRQWYTDKSTIGRFFIDGQYACYTLEDRVRPNGAPKVYGETAIAAGTYEVSVTMSARFKKRMPYLHDVPNFTGVRIHCGNKPQDTEGCILLGESKGTDRIGKSRAAYRPILAKIEAALERGESVSLQITDTVEVT